MIERKKAESIEIILRHIGLSHTAVLCAIVSLDEQAITGLCPIQDRLSKPNIGLFFVHFRLLPKNVLKNTRSWHAMYVTGRIAAQRGFHPKVEGLERRGNLVYFYVYVAST